MKGNDWFWTQTLAPCFDIDLQISSTLQRRHAWLHRVASGWAEVAYMDGCKICEQPKIKPWQMDLIYLLGFDQKNVQAWYDQSGNSQDLAEVK